MASQRPTYTDLVRNYVRALIPPGRGESVLFEIYGVTTRNVTYKINGDVYSYPTVEYSESGVSLRAKNKYDALLKYYDTDEKLRSMVGDYINSAYYTDEIREQCKAINREIAQARIDDDPFTLRKLRDENYRISHETAPGHFGSNTDELVKYIVDTELIRFIPLSD